MLRRNYGWLIALRIKRQCKCVYFSEGMLVTGRQVKRGGRWIKCGAEETKFRWRVSRACSPNRPMKPMPVHCNTKRSVNFSGWPRGIFPSSEKFEISCLMVKKSVNLSSELYNDFPPFPLLLDTKKSLPRKKCLTYTLTKEHPHLLFKTNLSKNKKKVILFSSYAAICKT